MNHKSAFRTTSLCLWLLAGADSAVAGPIMEVGRLTVHNTFDDATFTAVEFQQSYTQAPLVFALPTNAGGNPTTLRLRNVSNGGFEIVTAEPPRQDGQHVAMSTSYLAIVPGVYEFGGGLVIEAGHIDTTTTVRQGSSPVGFEPIGFSGTFDAAPALLVDIQTMNNESQDTPPPRGTSTPWMTAHAQGITANGAEVALERAEVHDQSVVTQSERIGYVALSQGIFSFDSLLGELVTVESLITGPEIRGWDNSSGVGNSVALAGDFATAPLIFANLASRNGNNGGWLRRGEVTSSSVDLLVDEDQYLDNERNHIREQASVVAFSDTFVYGTDDPRLLGPTNGPMGAPEPGVTLLMGAGLAGLGFQRRRRGVA